MFVFLDDERKPPASGKFASARVVRSYDEFKKLVDCTKLIKGISFDHDLGDAETGMDCAHYLISADMDRDILDRDFVMRVHSMNPVGARNIEMLMANYLQTKWPDFFH